MHSILTLQYDCPHTQQDRSRRKRQRRETHEADEDAIFAAELLGLVHDRVRDTGDFLRIIGDTAGGLAGGSIKLLSASVKVNEGIGRREPTTDLGDLRIVASVLRKRFATHFSRMRGSVCKLAFTRIYLSQLPWSCCVRRQKVFRAIILASVVETLVRNWYAPSPTPFATAYPLCSAIVRQGVQRLMVVLGVNVSRIMSSCMTITVNQDRNLKSESTPLCPPRRLYNPAHIDRVSPAS